MKKLIIILTIAFASCTKNTAPPNTTTDHATITSVQRVNEPNGNIGRRVNFTTILFTAVKLKVYKQNLVQHLNYWEPNNITPSMTFTDHNAGLGEVWYTFRWEYVNGTDYWQVPQSTKL